MLSCHLQKIDILKLLETTEICKRARYKKKRYSVLQLDPQINFSFLELISHLPSKNQTIFPRVITILGNRAIWAEKQYIFCNIAKENSTDIFTARSQET